MVEHGDNVVRVTFISLCTRRAIRMDGSGDRSSNGADLDDGSSDVMRDQMGHHGSGGKKREKG